MSPWDARSPFGDPQRGSGGHKRLSDPELPESLGFAVAPSRTPGDRVLQSAYGLASTGCEEGFAVDGDHVEALVVGAVERDDRIFAENFSEVFLEQLCLFSSQKQEGRSFTVIAFGADQVRYCFAVPDFFKRKLGRNGYVIRVWQMMGIDVHDDGWYACLT